MGTFGLGARWPGRAGGRRGQYSSLWLAAVACVALFTTLTALFEGDAAGWTAFDDVGELLAALAAALACAFRARREQALCVSLLELSHAGIDDFELALQRQTRIAWALLAGGMGAWAAGQAGWTLYEVGLGITPPSPSWLDVLFLSSSMLVIAGLLAMARTAAGHVSHVRGAVEAFFIATACALLSWSLIGSTVLASKASALSQAVNLAYPALDAAALAAVLFVTPRRGEHPLAGLGLLGVGIVCLAISDSAFWYLSAHEEVAGATPLDAGWVAGFLSIALAALPRGRARGGRRRRAGTSLLLLLPGLPAVAAILVLGARWVLAGRLEVDQELLGIMGALLTLSVALLVVVLYENRALMGNLERIVQERTAQLRTTERYYRALVQRSSDVVMVVGPDLEVRYVSDSIRTIFGHSPVEIAGRSLDALGEGAAKALSEAIERSVQQPDRVTKVKWELIDANGRARQAESTVTNLLAERHVGAFVLNTRDDTDRAALEEQLRQQAFRDPLTGLANRALLGDRARQAFLRSQRTAGSVAAIALDLDSFKLVNDRMGHQAGDLLLRSVAGRLRTAVRPEDTVARVGGDEFVVLIDGVHDAQHARALAERVLDALRPPYRLGERQYSLTASVGVAIDSPPHSNFDQLLSDADVALYAVKTGGRDAVGLFEPSMHRHARERFQLQSDLREGLDREELWLLYQPEFDREGAELEGFEALVRWNHPTRGLLAPDRFIPLAEETGLIVPLGRWVLQQALLHAATWPPLAGGERPLTISVNVSAVQLGSPGIVADVRTALERSGVEPARVVLEITESSLMDGSPRVVSVLHELKALGVRLAIDDFGTGYASIAYLQQIPVDILKVDRSFVLGSQEGRRGRELLEAIVNIGHVLSLVTVAEGIEQPNQLETVQEVGCDLVQGYLLSRPLPEEGVRELIAEQRAAGARRLLR